MTNPAPPQPSNTETDLDAAYQRFQEAVQHYFKTAGEALAEYTRTMEEAGVRFRDSQQSVMELLQKSMIL